jgi:hypothetical protein
VTLQSLQLNPHPTLLELWSSLFRCHWKNEALQGPLHQSVLQLSEIMRPILSAGNSSAHDQIIGYFDALGKTMRSSARVVVGDNVDFAVTLLEWIGINIQLPEPLIVRRSCTVIKCMFQACSAHQPLQAALNQQMPVLLGTSLYGITHSAIRSLINPLAEVLFDYYKLAPDAFLAWFQEQLSNPAIVPVALQDHDRATILKAVVDARTLCCTCVLRLNSRLLSGRYAQPTLCQGA